MAKKARRPHGPLPPPLPPETRTVGQLVAESIRFYGRRFWWSLVLGIGPAAVTVAGYEVGWHPAIAAVGAGYVVLASISYVGACLLVSGIRPPNAVIANAYALAVLIVLPALLLSFAAALPAVVWLALLGMAVPASLVERLSPRDALRRGIALGRVDYWHAFGSLLALAIVVFLTQALLFSLLHGGSKQAVDISAFLASLVVQPILFIGSAILYFDQAARVESRANADLRDAHDPDDAGPADAQRTPGSLAGGQP